MLLMPIVDIVFIMINKYMYPDQINETGTPTISIYHHNQISHDLEGVPSQEKTF